ncbi:MAG: 50S ribosomal protein L10 [Candidatus Hydrogenedentes bacterium]|nr:50S ribosomal protein L10 [Candidatus Hydrogenedentota bacterium]
MARPEKMAAIEELKANISSHTIAILTKYQGINVAEVTELRKKLRGEQITFKVYKNTLAKRALDELDLSEVSNFLEGPTAWAFSEDPVAPAKILKNFGKDVKFIQMQGGILDGKMIDASLLNTLADLPSRDQLLAQVVGTIAAPLRSLVGVLSAVPRNAVNVLDQIRKQKEEAEAA